MNRGGIRIGHSMAKPVFLKEQYDSDPGDLVPGGVLLLWRCLPDPAKAESRRRMPAGRPYAMSAPWVLRPFRSGRWFSWAFSTRMETARIRVIRPRTAVKDARVRCRGFIRYFLFTKVNRQNWARGYINPRIPTIFAVFFLFCRITRVLAKRYNMVTGPRSRIGTAEPDPVPFTHPVAVSGRTRCREGTWSLQPSRPARGVRVQPC